MENRSLIPADTQRDQQFEPRRHQGVPRRFKRSLPDVARLTQLSLHFIISASVYIHKIHICMSLQNPAPLPDPTPPSACVFVVLHFGIPRSHQPLYVCTLQVPTRPSLQPLS